MWKAICKIRVITPVPFDINLGEGTGFGSFIYYNESANVGREEPFKAHCSHILFALLTSSDPVASFE